MVAKTVDDSFICPLSKLIMADPVVAADGETYEREKLEEWLKDNNTSPVTADEFEHKTVNPTSKQQQAIQKYLAEHPESYDKEEVYLPKAWIKGFADAINNKNLPQLQMYLARDKRLLTREIEIAAAPDELAEATSVTPLELACKMAAPEIVDFLIDELVARNLLDEKVGLKLDSKPLNILLEKYLTANDSKKCELLLKLGADVEQPDASKRTLLHRMVNILNLPAATWLLEHKADIEARNSSLETPLFIAVNRCSIPLINFLLENGADKEARNILGITPLYTAVRSQNVNLVNALLDYGADPTSLKNSESLLHIATTKAMLGRLFNTGAASLINAEDSAGNTALHKAATSGSEEVLVYLLEKGANRKVLNKAGQLPIDCAKARPNIQALFTKTVQKINNRKNAEVERLKTETALLKEKLNEQDKILQDVLKRMAQLQSPEIPKGLLSARNIFLEQAVSPPGSKEEPQPPESAVKSSIFTFGLT